MIRFRAKCRFWRRFQRKLIKFFGADVDMQRKLDEVGKELDNIKKELAPMIQLVKVMREEHDRHG